MNSTSYVRTDSLELPVTVEVGEVSIQLAILGVEVQTLEKTGGLCIFSVLPKTSTAHALLTTKTTA